MHRGDVSAQIATEPPGESRACVGTMREQSDQTEHEPP